MGGGAPKQDPNMGIAALKSAETGQQMLEWMKGQAEITNKWAADDRARETTVFRPLQDKFIADAQGYDTPERREAEAARASADVALASNLSRGQMERQLTGMGVNPASGRFASSRGRMAMDTALASAGAGNLARKAVEAEGDAREAQAINLGMGLAVNPGTSMGLSNSAGSAGFQGAMNGYGQQAQILNTDYNNRMQAWQAKQGGISGLFSGLGAIAGAGMGPGGFLTTLLASSKDYKTDKKPAKGNLDAVRKMPVEEWTYKEGIADGGRHVGPYAEDFKAATGKGDGKTIPVIDQMGVTMGAVQELADKVDKLAARIDRKPMGAMREAA